MNDLSVDSMFSVDYILENISNSSIVLTEIIHSLVEFEPYNKP